MTSLLSRLRVGEAIGLSFGLVGVLFLAVIWQYHDTLTRALAAYHRQEDVYGAKTLHAHRIGRNMLEARLAVADFLSDRRLEDAERVRSQVDYVLAGAKELAAIDAAGRRAGERIEGLTRDYYRRFESVVEAWRTQGLDHNSGLQGRFRRSVHELEVRAGHFKVGGLYLELLQIRRREKDLGLRREARYETAVLDLVGELRADTVASGLAPEVKATLLREIKTYEDAFRDYARKALAHRDIGGGKGPFRQAAHRIEALLAARLIPGLEAHILQLRRREKDYLLRGDQRYVDWVKREVATIGEKIARSEVSKEEKASLVALLESYRDDFVALVAQNRRIASLSAEMRDSARQITALVEENIAQAGRALAETNVAVEARSRQDARLMVWIALAATLLGVFFAVVITRGITRPLSLLGGILGRLAHSDPVERLPHAGGRGEIGAMAEALNTLLDHRERLIAWSMASLREDDARFHGVVDRALTGVVVTDGSGTITDLSPEAEAIFQTRAARVIGQGLQVLVPELRFSGQGPPGAGDGAPGAGREVTGRTAEGQALAVWVAWFPVHTGGDRWYLFMVRDLSARREAEAQWREARRQRRELLAALGQEGRACLEDIERNAGRILAAGGGAKIRREAGAIRSTTTALRNLLWILASPGPDTTAGADRRRASIES